MRTVWALPTAADATLKGSSRLVGATTVLRWSSPSCEWSFLPQPYAAPADETAIEWHEEGEAATNEILTLPRQLGDSSVGENRSSSV